MSELYIPQPRPTINKANGRFLPGHVPANKGKKWDEFMSKRGQRKARKGWKNIEKMHAFGHPPTIGSGRCRKAVVSIDDNGKLRMFHFIGAASKHYGIVRDNVRRCCNENAKQHVNKKTGKINTDHKYMGLRFYFESDFEIWKTKVTS